MQNKIHTEITELSIANSCICSKLKAASRMVSRTYDHALKPIGLNSNQMTILVAVSLMSPVSITKLSEKLSMERTTLTRNLRPIEKSGFIELQDGYGRTRELKLTVAGQSILSQAKPLWDAAQSDLIEKLGEDDTSMINLLLKKILKNDVT